MEKNEVFDYFQEIARSAFADMLHDTERNQKYSAALKETIENVKKQGKQANVLDIGTGTGLLAMLAAQHGADSVVTIETFSPVSQFARKIIDKNGFKDKIKVINKHSTEVKVGEHEEMKQKANILVAEVFDTELIGEGALKTYNEAHKHLLDDDCIAIPHKANVYIQIVKSELASSWYTVNDMKIDEEQVIKAPDDVTKCRGLSSINDIQLSQFPLKDFKAIAEPVKICEFNFSSNKLIPNDESFNYAFQSKEDTESVIIFFWWDIHMNQSGSNLLSCAPYWAHPDTNPINSEIEKRNGIPWRDHWMQGCYYVPKSLEKGVNYVLTASHDEFSWFFDVYNESKVEKIERPLCSCFLHICNSRNQIMQMNDESKRQAFIKLLRNVDLNNVLFIGDHSLVSLIAASITTAKKITVYQEDELCFKSLRKFIECNNLNHKINLINDLTYAKDITHLIADPCFNSAILPLDNITQISTIVQNLCKLNQQPFKVYPQRARIFTVPVHFMNLHKIRWPLESSCEGFNHECFDEVVELASKIADDNVEPFSLWEYPCYALGKRSNIFEVDFNENKISQAVTNIEIDNFSKSCNGMAFWIEWILDENDIIISTGPLNEIVSGELINWKFDRQAVHLIHYKDIVTGILKSIDIKFHLKDEIAFDFSYHYEK
ncbi:protein arginine N-methyltransferase 7 [Chironomus tepperi]|uniref:protein arginine N-methyltransferase 7 n=1 Tax=Chironomus tepperi TaxID=113505 RepID=UPI00391F58ED